MNVVQSKDFTWAPGMKTMWGSRFFGSTWGTEWWINPDGELWETDDYMNKRFEPDLEDGPTQGAIIFGIFEPLGVGIVTNFGMMSDGSEDDYSVRVSPYGKSRDLEMHDERAAYRTKADAIRAVFAALDSGADRG